MFYPFLFKYPYKWREYSIYSKNLYIKSHHIGGVYISKTHQVCEDKVGLCYDTYLDICVTEDDI